MHARFTATGPDAAARIQEWFAQVQAGLTVTDPIAEAGTGPLAFVSLGFDDTDVAVAVVAALVVVAVVVVPVAAVAAVVAAVAVVVAVVAAAPKVAVAVPKVAQMSL